jgi:hypothetical protein
MGLLRTSAFLRLVLYADAATCLAAGLLMVLGAGALEQSLGLPAVLSRYAGVSLFPFAAFLIYLSRRENLSPPAIWTVIVLNAIWTIGSFLLLLTGWIAPNDLGNAFIAVQALGVAVFACLEYVGLRKSQAATV